MDKDTQISMFDLPPVESKAVSFDPSTFPQEVPESEEIATTQDAEQPTLLNLPEWWEEHWRGMPEYISEDLMPFKSIFVHFEDREAIEAFAKLVGQSVGLQTKCLWFPEAEIGRTAGKRYVDKSSVLYKDKQRPK